MSAAPRQGKVFQAEMSVARLAPLLENQTKGAADIAKKVFAGDKEGDKVVLSVSGGASLKLRLSMKTKLLQFINLIDEAQKGSP
jgi:hypothetical protein